MKEPDPGLIDHTIQKHIIRTLVSSSNARFSELKPSRIESNLLMYHLNQLIKRGVVIKQDGAYALSTAGSAFVDRANLDSLEFRVQPKIISILAIKSGKGNWLLLERLHEPHKNRVGFPSGKLHYGEELESAAVRELEEKAGIKDIHMNLAGNIIMRFMDKDAHETLNHTIGYIFTAHLENEPEIINASKHWRSFWGAEAKLIKGNVFKGHEDILKLLASDGLFIKSLEYTSDY